MTNITMMQRFGRASLVGIAGAIVASAIMMSDSAFRHEFGFLRAATMGAFLAGMILARGFGGAGAWGWFRTGITFGAATVLGAIIAVPLMGFDAWLMSTDLIRGLWSWSGSVLLGPVYVLSLLGGSALVLKAWVAFGILFHLVLIRGKRRQISP